MELTVVEPRCSGYSGLTEHVDRKVYEEVLVGQVMATSFLLQPEAFLSSCWDCQPFCLSGLLCFESKQKLNNSFLQLLLMGKTSPAEFLFVSQLFKTWKPYQKELINHSKAENHATAGRHIFYTSIAYFNNQKPCLKGY